MQDSKRNLIIFFFESIIFACGMAFISTAAVIPYFLDEMGASTFAIGLSGAMTPLMCLAAGPFFASLTTRLRHKNTLYVKMLMAQRWSFFVFALFIPVLAPDMPLTVFLFLVMWALFNVAVASYNPFYYAIFIKCVPIRRQADLRGFSCLIAYLLAIPVSFLVGYMMKVIPSPYSYAAIFGVGSVFLIINAFLFGLIKEPPEDEADVVKAKPRFFESYKDYWKVWKQEDKLRYVLLGNLMLFASVSLVAYYTMCAKREYGAGPTELSIFMSIGLALTALGSALAGYLVNKMGNGRVLLMAGACSVLSGLVLLFFKDMNGIYVGYGLTMLASSGYNICAALLILRQSAPSKSAVNIGLNIFLCQLLTCVLLLVGAPLIDAFSFPPIFLLVSLTGLLAMVFYLVAGIKGVRG